MNINFEETPNVIFDWVEKFSFAELNDSQKTEVLLYLSEEDYTGMFEASKSLKTILKSNETGSSNPVRKNMLLNHLDASYNRKKRVKFKAVIAWQAAALILMVLSGWLFYRVFDLQKSENIFQVASTDTVYVTKEISAQPEYIHDTVYLYKESERSSKENSSATKSAYSDDLKGLNAMEALPVKEQGNSTSLPKGNSMKDDSLLKKFGFVAM